MKTNKKYIDNLLTRFFDGTSTVAEERELRSYFASGRIDPEHERHRAMFGWYSTTLAPARRKPSWHRIVMVAASVAALIALVVGIGFFSEPGIDAELEATYSGSYVIRNGKKISDLTTIMPQILRAQQLMAQADQEWEELSTIEERALQEALPDIDDPELRDMLLLDQ